MAHPARDRLLKDLASRCPAGPAAGAWAVRVAVDGVDGAGKTTFADDLAAALVAAGRRVVRVGVDDFHRPRADRYARGRADPDGFFTDSFDYDRLRADVLAPLGPGGDGVVCRRAFDHVRDAPVEAPDEQVPRGGVLVLDGLFLHRDGLRGVFDWSVFLRVPFAVSVARTAARDGTSPDPGAPSNRRYVLGQQRYLRECAPESRATVVVDHTDAARPFVVEPRQPRGA